MRPHEFEAHPRALIDDFAKRLLRKQARLVPSEATEEWLQALRQAYGDGAGKMPTGVFAMVINKAIKASPIVATEAAPPGWAWVPKNATHEWATAIKASEAGEEWPSVRDIVEVVQQLFDLAPSYTEPIERVEPAAMPPAPSPWDVAAVPRSLLASQKGA